jgi:flavin-dependent dehydrogenase
MTLASSAPVSSGANRPYDVIIVGARCAGSPTAMLLARRGLRVLLVDKVTFPRDTMRAHFIRGGGVGCLERWEMLPQVAATGCPAMDHIVSDFGDGPLLAPASLIEGEEMVYGPRRIVLDALLVAEAAKAGAEVREAFTVADLLWENDRVVGVRGRTRSGTVVSERASLVVGADGMHSLVARAVAAPSYDVGPPLSCGYYGYFGEIPLDHLEVARLGDRCAVAMPTNDGLTLVFVAAPVAELDAFRHDTEAAFFRTLAAAPWIAEKVRPELRAERWRGTGDLPSFFRKPYGPGWALVGDAGYHQDPITARGISNAFRDAEFLADAVTAGLSGQQPLDAALAAYEARRNEAARPGYDEARLWASGDPFPPALYAQRAALRAAAVHAPALVA